MRRLTIAALMTVLTVTGIVLTGCGEQRPAGTPPVTVNVGRVKQQSQPVTVRAVGNLAAARSVVVTPQVTGKLQEVFFRDGQMVSEGQILAAIDPAPFRAAVEQARAGLEMQQSQLAYSRDQFERYKQLLAQGAISYQDYEAVLTDLNRQKAGTDNAQAQLDLANINLGYCTITAPISGKIGYIQVYPGNIVTANVSQIATINQIAPIYADFAVPEQYLGALSASQEQVQVSLYDGNDQLLADDGRLVAFNNQVTANTGSLKLRAEFANRSGRLFPGQFCSVVLTLGREENALTVPATAVIVSSDSEGTVFVVGSDNRVSARKIAIGRKVGDTLVVKSGLTDGEMIATDGLMGLRDGSPVKIAGDSSGDQQP
ncbi:MAG: efflux RND transporter periplasmic adaptor subunit [Negativicutes bacterium]|nr:efflux RND transporter periplasmic adaptor subunit [Negativicutes bacterium]